jgi:hypothetical protein
MSANEDLIFRATDGLSVSRDDKRVIYSLPVSVELSRWMYVTRYLTPDASLRYIPMVGSSNDGATTIGWRQRAWLPGSGRLVSATLSSFSATALGVTTMGMHINGSGTAVSQVSKSISVADLGEVFLFLADVSRWSLGDSVSISVNPTAITASASVNVNLLFELDGA